MNPNDNRLALAVEPGDEVRIKLDFGQLTVTATDDGNAYVDIPEVNDGEEPKVDIKRNGSVVELNLGFDSSRTWRGWVGSFRELHWHITLPEYANVTAHNPVGQMRVSGFKGGTLNLSTDAGQLRIEDVSGTLKLRTAAGQIRGEQVGGTIDAAAEAGEVRLDVTYLDPGNHRLRTEAGAIRVTLDPATKVRIDARATLGSVRSQVPSVADAPAVIVASAEIGSVRIRYRDDDGEDTGRREERKMARDERQRARDRIARELEQVARAREQIVRERQVHLRQEPNPDAQVGPRGVDLPEPPYPQPAPFPRPASHPVAVGPVPPTPPIPPAPPVPPVPPVPPSTSGTIPVAAPSSGEDSVPVVRQRQVVINKGGSEAREAEMEAILRQVEEGSLSAADAMELLSQIDR